MSGERSPAVGRLRLRDRYHTFRQEAALMTLVGCDLHTRKQQVAVLDTETGETHERQLVHEGSAVEEFYAALPRPVTVGIESTGYAIWFHALSQRLGHTVLVGDAAKIRAMVVRKTKTDRRDALHLLDLLRHDRFPRLGAGPRHPRSARPAHAPYAPRPYPHHGQEWPARHRPELPPRPWLQTPPPGGPGPTARPGPPPAHRPAPGSKPRAARGPHHPDPGAGRRHHHGGPRPPRRPAPDYPPGRRGPDGAGHRRRVG